MKITFEPELWDALSEEDKVSLSGVHYRPGEEVDEEGNATGMFVICHPNINEVDDLMLAVAKIRRAKKYRENKNAS